MKRIAAVIVMITAFAAVSAFVGCSGSSNNGRTVRSGRGTGAGGTGAGVGGIPGAANTQGGTQLTSPQSTGQLGWGIVTPSKDSDVQAFLSTDFSQGQVGNVVSPCTIGSALGGGPCLIKFTVTKLPQPAYNPVTLTAGVLSQALQSQTPVPTTDGYLTLAVWDSMSGTNPGNDPNFAQGGLPPITVVIPLSTQAAPNTQGGFYSTVSASGAVKNISPSKQVTLFFGDNEGNVLISGDVQGNQLSGTIQFGNLVTMQPGGTQSAGGASGSLGTFQINLCDILAPCN